MNNKVLRCLKKERTCVHIVSEQDLDKVKNILIKAGFDIKTLINRNFNFKVQNCVRIASFHSKEKLLFACKEFYQNEHFTIIPFSSLIEKKLTRVRFINF